MSATHRLTAPAPGWTATTDVVVVGSGVAGLTVALNARKAGLRTMVVTKAMLDDGSTRWAQGGIAAALGEGDTPAQHLDDTLVAGAGICDEEAVRTLVTEGPDAVRRLIARGGGPPPRAPPPRPGTNARGRATPPHPPRRREATA
ncbi:FAD-dependent oxidoreductase, partial [Kitasatospora sp. NPDC059803]|uniref:FAD-dependent oxidoreductase n=1 Tax=Kitasatospora sp. NPDC059803 TaxID=3346953 RepID=UPI0036679262